jgi:hypothetical protein
MIMESDAVEAMIPGEMITEGDAAEATIRREMTMAGTTDARTIVARSKRFEWMTMALSAIGSTFSDLRSADRIKRNRITPMNPCLLSAQGTNRTLPATETVEIGSPLERTSVGYDYHFCSLPLSLYRQ